MSQSKEELDRFYQRSVDPWAFTTTPDDHRRKDAILKVVGKHKPYKRALDVGAGEGWITQDLPAKEIDAIELSDVAASRFPKGIRRVPEPYGTYDLILAAGVFYRQYEWRQMLDWVKQYTKGYLVISGIKDWLVPELEELGKPVYKEEFKYREFTQEIRVYKK